MFQPTPLSRLDAYLVADVPIHTLWLNYLSIGGNWSRHEFTDYLCARDDVDDHEHDVVAQVLNESLMDHDAASRVAYRQTVMSFPRPL